MSLVSRRFSLAAAVMAGTVLAAPALAETVPPSMISVTGEASEANNAAMGKVLLALKAAGVAEKDIQTSRLSLQPQYSPNRSGSSPVVGYRASNRVTVRLHDVTRVAGAIDTLVGAGATDIGGINFSVSNASKLLDDAREQAVADARRKAEIYARAAGVTLGAPLSISEEGAPGPMPFRKMAVGMAASPAPVALGEETLQVTVSVSWAIK